MVNQRDWIKDENPIHSSCTLKCWMPGVYITLYLTSCEQYRIVTILLWRWLTSFESWKSITTCTFNGCTHLDQRSLDVLNGKQMMIALKSNLDIAWEIGCGHKNHLHFIHKSSTLKFVTEPFLSVVNLLFSSCVALLLRTHSSNNMDI